MNAAGRADRDTSFNQRLNKPLAREALFAG